jgi:predicted aspartyl protease
VAKHSSPRPDSKDLEKFGPRLEIEVGLPIIRDSQKSGIPAATSPSSKRSSRMPALIDTGASRTVLTPEAIQKLDLPLVDFTTVSRAGGTDRASVHAASIQFPRSNLTPIELIQVLCCELPYQPIHCLIGRDILSRWIFTYNGQIGDWSINDEKGLAVWVEPPEGVYDVFICHASEDKPFVEPLVSALKADGINVWYDNDRMKWGDDLRSSIDKGLSNSRFGIVVFSKAFLKKKRWTEHELNGLFAKESYGEKVILPIRHGITGDDLAEYSPSFVDRLAMDSKKHSVEEIVRNLKSRLGRTS